MNCLITGASCGIGASLAIKLASLNYNLLLTYNTNYVLCKKLQNEIINNYQVKCIIVKCDLRREEDIKNVYQEFKNNYNTLDLLVNNASYSCDNLIEDKTKEEFLDVVNVNLIGTFLMCKYAFKIMAYNSLIINMSSTDGIDTYSIYNIDYSVSKAGINLLTKNLSLINKNIRIVAVAPNWVNTESTREMSKDYLESELKRINQKRLIEIDEVIDKIVNIIVDKNILSGSIIRIEGE